MSRSVDRASAPGVTRTSQRREKTSVEGRRAAVRGVRAIGGCGERQPPSVDKTDRGDGTRGPNWLCSSLREVCMDPHGSPVADQIVGMTIGNYLVKQKLGEGGMGSVYLAEHPHIG